MYQSFLEAFLTPDRAGAIAYAVTMLDDLGVPDMTANVDALVMAGSPNGNEGVVSAIEEYIGDVITDAFTLLGVGIEYDPELLDDHSAFLWFLATWGTSSGPVPSEVTNLESMYDLEGDDRDRLHEFYALCDGDDVSDLIWVEDVSPFLIAAIDTTLKASLVEDEDTLAPMIATSVLNPIRQFSALYPESFGVKHMVLTGQFIQDLEDVVESYLPQLSAIPDVHTQAVQFASLGLISDVPRPDLVEELKVILINTIGANTRTQELIMAIDKIYRSLGVI